MLTTAEVRERVVSATSVARLLTMFLALGGCDADSKTANRWPDECNMVMKPLETAALADSGGSFSAPHDVRLSRYSAEHCVRLASIWWANRSGSEDDIADLAVKTCNRQIAEEMQQQAAWEAQPLTSDPRMQAELNKAQQQMKAQLAASHSTPMDLHRDEARDNVKWARAGQCWRFIDPRDVASLVAQPGQ